MLAQSQFLFFSIWVLLLTELFIIRYLQHMANHCSRLSAKMQRMHLIWLTPVCVSQDHHVPHACVYPPIWQIRHLPVRPQCIFLLLFLLQVHCALKCLHLVYISILFFHKGQSHIEDVCEDRWQLWSIVFDSLDLSNLISSLVLYFLALWWCLNAGYAKKM